MVFFAYKRFENVISCYPIALRKAKIVCYFGFSEFNRVCDVVSFEQLGPV